MALFIVTCRGCGESWDNDSDPCACTCTDPTAPGYEDWVVEVVEP